MAGCQPLASMQYVGTPFNPTYHETSASISSSALTYRHMDTKDLGSRLGTTTSRRGGGGGTSVTGQQQPTCEEVVIKNFGIFLFP